MNDKVDDFRFRATPEQLAGMLATGTITEEEYRQAIRNNKTNCERWLDEYITLDKELIEVKKQCRILSRVDDPVLIRGETGTGKEILAKALHGDRKGNFIAVNCAGIPETLLEAELFGTAKGGFTNAINRDGLMAQANNGTLFMDEIGEMPMQMQAKILRALQERKIRKVGGDIDIDVSCRIIAASHLDFEKAIVEKKFRDDLYYRLSMFELWTKPMSIRSADIEPIVDHLDDEKKIKDVRWFCSFIEPDKLKGNVRSLQQIVRRYLVLGILPHDKKKM